MSLRRSQRGSSRSAAPKHEFSVGDVVELMTGSGLCTAQLLHSARKGRWLVAFDKEELADKELSDKSFGSVVARAEDQSSAHSTCITNGGSSKARTARRIGSSTEKTASSGEGKAGVSVGVASRRGNRAGRGGNSNNRQESLASSSDNGANDASKLVKVSPSSAKGRKRVSTRSQSPTPTKKQRSARNGEKGAVIATRSRVKNGVASAPLQHQFDMFKSPPKVRGRGQQKRRNHNPKCEDGTVVVKVEMLTGTLYLYRGKKPRAEFIRRV